MAVVGETETLEIGLVYCIYSVGKSGPLIFRTSVWQPMKVAAWLFFFQELVTKTELTILLAGRSLGEERADEFPLHFLSQPFHWVWEKKTAKEGREFGTLLPNTAARVSNCVLYIFFIMHFARLSLTASHLCRIVTHSVAVRLSYFLIKIHSRDRSRR